MGEGEGGAYFEFWPIGGALTRRGAYSRGVGGGALIRVFIVLCFRFSVVGELGRFVPQTHSFPHVFSLTRLLFRSSSTEERPLDRLDNGKMIR